MGWPVDDVQAQPSSGSGGMWQVAAAGAGQLLGGMLQNRAQRQEAARARRFNAKQAQINREFQERMSNTAWRRAMADMRAAGINPMLAIDKGGASTPGGGAASGPMAQMQNELGPATTGAMDAIRLRNDLATAQKQRELIGAQTTAAESTARLNDANSARAIAGLPEVQARGEIGGAIRDTVRTGWRLTKEGWRQLPGALWQGITQEYLGTARAQMEALKARARADAARREAERRAGLGGDAPVTSLELRYDNRRRH